ncbi:uncharacterized protein YwnB-like isoform X2 [Lineus longissimus]|uniref:uncharacterized protein YwnB-like isoform X2 n=1 Tax=Lineus longissimus TaxID=88925 RepID=UPI00315C9C97
MKICVCGATGPSGQRLVQQALDAGHQVIALVRTPEKVEAKHDNLKVEKVDVCNVEDLVPHFTGSDAIMSCLGHAISFFTAQTFYSESCKAIVEAMRKADVKRLVAITSWCTVYKPEHPKFIEWFLKPVFIGRNLADMARMETYLQNECSDITWTCVKPPGLTNDPITEKLITAAEGELVRDAGFQMSRSDVVRFMLSIIEDQQWNQKLVAIGLVNTA